MPRHRRLTFLASLTIALALLLTGCPLVDQPPSEHSLHVTIVGNGTVTSNPQGIDCPGTCTTDFADTAVVDLAATPGPGHAFDTWTGDPDCSDGRVTMTNDRTCVATFQPGSGFAVIASGDTHSLALDHHGHAWAWGYNLAGQVGDGTTGTARWEPTRVTMPAGTTFTSIDGGDVHSLALDRNGHAWAWGHDGSGQIGNGTTGSIAYASSPTQVTMPVGITFSAISAGWFSSLALDQNGHAWAWGSNEYGQIGDGTEDVDRHLPTPVIMPAGITFTAISAGAVHSLALDQSGHAWAWGNNEYGQIGDGTEDIDRLVPTPVTAPAGVTFTAITGGKYHSLALDQNGHAWAWGANEYGQVGDGTTGDVRWAPTPVIMPTGTAFATIVGGNFHSLALDQNGHAWAWGNNGAGQVGDGTTGDVRWAPTPVIMAAGTSFTTMGGGGHSLAIDQHGDAWAWGANSSGQLGTGTNQSPRLVPTAVDMP